MPAQYQRQLAAWLLKEYGMRLSKCGGKRSVSNEPGAWKTGWMLGGCRPGFAYGHYRYTSLRQIARQYGYKWPSPGGKPKGDSPSTVSAPSRRAE